MSEEFLAGLLYVVDARLPWDIERPREAEASFRAELSRPATTPEEQERHAELLTQLARAQALQGRTADAHSTLAQSERLLLTIPAVRPRIRQLLEQGRVLVRDRLPARARLLFIQAFDAARQTGDTFLAIDAAQMLSVVETPKLQTGWIEQALALAQGAPVGVTWVPALEQARGWRHLEDQQFDKALACFQRALTTLEAGGDAHKIARARYCVARGLRAIRRFDEALAIQQALLGEERRLGRRDGLVYEEVAECLQALKQPKDAQTYFAQAHALLSQDQWLVDNRPARLNRLKTMGKVPARV